MAKHREEIREKAMRAWVQQRRVEVKAWGNSPPPVTGKIIAVQPDKDKFTFMTEPDDEERSYMFLYVADIHFLDEEEEDRTQWGSLIDFARQSQTQVCVTTENGGQVGHFVQAGLLHGRPYGILRIYDGTTVRVYHAEITEIAFRGEASKKPPPDVAKELWEWEEFTTHSELYQIGVERDERGIATSHMATNQQKAVIGAAPELLGMLEKYDKAMGAIGITLKPDFAHAVQGVINKARRSDGKSQT